MRKLILAFGALALIAGLLVGVFHPGRAYRHYKERRGLRLAQKAIAAGNLENASVSARQVLQLNPKSVEACLIMAGLAESCHSPAVIEWRQRVADLAPTVANRLKLASCALRFQRPPYALAAQALRQLEPLAGNLAAFHVISAELALRLNQANEAEAHFQAAATLEPGNKLHSLNLAVLHLQSTSLTEIAAARHALEQLSTNDSTRVLALRWRVVDHLRHCDPSAAEFCSSELLADPRAQLDDRLQHLDILLSAVQKAKVNRGLPAPQGPGSGPAVSAFIEYLRKVQTDANAKPSEIYSVCEWMGTHGRADDALSWLAELEAKQRKVQPILLAEANLYLAKSDWSSLEAFLVGQKWEDLEFLRLALLARAAGEQRHSIAADSRWDSAVRAGSQRLGSLTLLLSLATEWKRNPEEVLWQIIRHFPREQWAFRQLEREYAAAGNTRGLNQVYGFWSETAAGANDRTNQNNFAATSMLLQMNLLKAHQTTRDLYHGNATDPILASTYAYSLHLQGRTASGLAIFSQLKQQALTMPSVSLYYGVLLAAAGEKEQAKPYLACAEKAQLLPEEMELLAKARRQAGNVLLRDNR